MVRHGNFRLFNRRTVVIAWAAVMSLAAGLLTATPASAAPRGPEPVKPPATSPGRAVKGVKPLPSRFVTPRDAAKETFRPTRTAWPRPATASVDLSQATAGTKVRGNGTPLWAQPVAGREGGAGARRLSMRVLDRSATEAAGVDGVLFSLAADPTTADRTADTGTVRVGLDYSGFAEAYGGNYGFRLRLARLPVCALSTPATAGCRTPQPLPSANDAAGRTVSAEVPVDEADSGPIVLAAVASAGDEGGKGGTYAATDLKPSGSWSGGGSTGSFTYSYPLAVPPAASDLVPSVALSYDSGSVDGQTASTNAQASWVGDGWSSSRSYVEQTFASCQDDPGGKPSPVKTYDRCYDGPVLTLALNGSTSSLVWDKDKRVWKPESDNGAVVSRVMNSHNGSGTRDTDYWRVVLRDGTTYEFGRNRLPGWTSDQPETKSVDHVPVYSPHEGDPCWNAAGFSSSVCTMAYRWNLDYVTDVHGNAMAYYYGQDINYYGRNKGATDVSYIRDSWLKRIDYGFTEGNAYGTVPNRVVFHAGDRCLSGVCRPLNESTKANWPDVPYDLVCNEGNNCDDWSPSFYSTVRLTSIETQQYNTDTSKHETVDSWALAHTLPLTGDGTSPTLWLASITRTGHDLSAGGSTEPITLPSVSFGGVKLANRVDTAGGLPNFYRQRLETITTETGSLITASYELPQLCAAPVTTDPATNGGSCYPVYWTPDGYSAPIKDWFQKWAVTKVTSTDPTGGAPALSTSYEYVGGAAWRYDENEVVKAKYRTYGQFRGYGMVKTRSGDGDNDRRTLSVTTYYRGRSKNNNSTVVNVRDSAGGDHEDRDELAGRELETTVHLGDGGPIESSTITSYWVSDAAATRTRTGLPALTASWVQPVKTWARQAVRSGGSTTWRYTGTDHSYDANLTSATFGLLKRTYSYTVPTNAAYDQCTSVAYAPVNVGKNLVGLVSETETVSVACGGFTQGTPASVPGSVNTLTAPATVNRPAQVVSHERTFYDDPEFDTTFPQTSAPSEGNETMTRVAADWSSGAYSYQTTARSTYDSYGRVKDSYDGNGNKTSAGYTMNAVGLTIGISTTNPLGHGSSTTINPRRGHPLVSTDLNQVATTQRYDALGRATAVWLYSRATSQPAHHTFAYTVSKTGVSGVTSQQLNMSNQYRASVTIYDALLRPRQTQAMTPDGGRMVTDTFYDSRGWVRETYNGWWDPATLPVVGNPVSARNLKRQVPNQTLNTYDGLGRAVVVTAAKDYVAISSTTTVYAGDRTTVVPPTGGVVKTIVTDPLGRAAELREYTALPTVTAPADPFTGTFTVTGGTTTVSTYGYDGHGNQATVTDAATNTWTSTYNLLGQVTSKDDPDAGISNMVYDGNGNLRQTTDARNKTISSNYDALNRKTAEYAATIDDQSAANQRAKWVYDNSDNAVPGMTNPLGQLTTMISYSGGRTYTTQQKGFNVFGASLGVTVTIPANEGLLGGSYTFEHTYNANVGLPLNDTFPAAGGLPAETVMRSYRSALDLPNGLAGLAGYMSSVTYDAFGRVNQAKIGAGTKVGYLTNAWDEHNGRLNEQLVTRALATPDTVDLQKYRYDLAGNVTHKISTRLGASTPSETQCYAYDKLARLIEAWTATDDCAVTPTPGNRSMVGNAIGGGSAYWTSWTMDAIGNRTEQTERSLSDSSGDITTTYTYDGNDGGQPHTLTAASKTGGATGLASFGYDAAGNTVTRNAAQGNQTLTWDDAGKLTGVSGGTGGPSSFVYNANGELLIQREPGKNTLYLPGQQLTLDTALGVVSGQRYYALPGGGMCIRTGSGTNYTFAIGDQQGTPSLYLDYTAQVPTWRQYTPYGGPRGGVGIYPDNRGFLDKPMSPSGLTMVGARAYDPMIGRFVSVDPIMDRAQPQHWNGYSYAENTPVTKSDPTGLIPDDCNQFDCYGYSPSKGCPGGCGTPENIKYGKSKKLTSTKSRLRENPRRMGRVVYVPHGVDRDHFARLWQERAAKQLRNSLEFVVQEELALAMNICRDMGDPGGCGQATKEWYDGYMSFNAELAGMDNGPNFGALGGGLRAGAKAQSRSCIGNSFDPDTGVLMADGATKAIEDVRVGDYVLATDPETGKSAARRVTALHKNADRNLADVTVKDEATGAISLIHTTSEHPFWSVTDGAWVHAAGLDAGDRLLDATGKTTQIVGGVRTWTGLQWMYNLTVADIHTYYVIAGNTPVLVHNCGDELDDVSRNIANHANGEALRPDGDGTHFVRGVDPKALGHYVDGVINGNVPNVRTRYLRNGRVGYWDADKRAVVIEDGDAGTVFTPRGGEDWFDNILK